MSALMAVVAAHVSSGIHVPDIRYVAILPEIIMLGGAALLVAIASLVPVPLRARVTTLMTMAVSLGALGFALWQWFDVQDHGAYTTIDHAVVIDGFSALVAIIVPCAMFLTALVGDGYMQREGLRGPEFHGLALVSASGAMLMGQANDLIIVFLGLEILSIALYVLAAFNHRRAASGEAALKYFLLGSFSSAIFIYGVALTYGATGSTNLVQIADFLSKNVVISNGLLLAGISLIFVGLAFKVAAVPFHMWTPDVYEGSPSPVVGFMAAVAKIGGFAALLRIFISSFSVLGSDWRPIVYVVAIVTMVVGAVLALVQRDVKRMLAYSSINHAGFVLLGLQAATATGVSSGLYYLFTYTFMVIGTFAIVTVLGGKGDGDHEITSYRGLAARQPVLALALALLLLAQAGAPFTTGFLAKFQVVAAAIDAHSIPLAVVAMVSAAIAAFFYLRLAVLMYAPVRPTPSFESADIGDAMVLGQRPFTVSAPDPSEPDESGGRLAVWAGTEQGVAVTQRLNAEVLLASDTAPSANGTAREADEPARVSVPPLAVLAIGLCLGVTIVFGVWPAPLTDLAHKATLLFLP